MTGQRIGCVRVSTLDQNSVRLLDGIAVDRVFEDKASGKDLNRSELEEMIKFVRDGDTVLVHSMDRLALAEFERALIRERQREGIALAKRRGAYRGRTPSFC